MRPDDRLRILDMIEEAENVSTFIDGHTREDLDTDRLLLYAVVRAIEVLGEAASKVSADARVEAPDVPWRDIVAMRNRLIHAYSAIDPETVWKAACEDIPLLVPFLRTLATRPEG